MRLFGHYTIEISNAFNSLKKLSKPLDQFLETCALPSDLSMEQILVLPVEHYSTYINNFRKYVHAVGDPKWGNAIVSESQYCRISDALNTVDNYSREVDATMEDEKEKQKLLAIQNKCKFCLLVILFFRNRFLNPQFFTYTCTYVINFPSFE